MFDIIPKLKTITMDFHNGYYFTNFSIIMSRLTFLLMKKNYKHIDKSQLKNKMGLGWIIK